MATKPPAPELRTLKILMLHGYAQSGPIFRAKTRALEKLLAKSFTPLGVSLSLLYPTAPNRLTTAQIPGGAPSGGGDDGGVVESFGWYRHPVGEGYHSLAEGMRAVAATVREAGGVDAVVGFSQGAAVTAVVAAALEPGREISAEQRRQCGSDGDGWIDELRAANAGRALRFAVAYSGFRCRVPALAWCYETPIRTPMLLFLGTLDTVVEEELTVALAERCEGGIVVRHPGGHHVPTTRQWAMPVVGWIREHMDRVV